MKSGRSLVPIIKGERKETEKDIPVLAELRQRSIERYWVMIRTKQSKMAVTLQDKQPYLLFDRVNDPCEMNNLIDKQEYAPIKEQLMHKIIEWEAN